MAKTMKDLETLGQEMKRLEQGDWLATVGLDVYSTFALIATVQLACRHPTFHGPTRKNAEQLARALQGQLAQASPELGRLAEQGWHPVFDLPRETKGGANADL